MVSVTNLPPVQPLHPSVDIPEEGISPADRAIDGKRFFFASE
jgi:hypothetical protein